MSRSAADKHLERLLVMVPWVSEQDGPTVEEVCERFEITERELAADLELLFMCGLYPFTPDTLIEADVVDGRVWIRFADAFQRPPAFTAEEAVSLVAAAAAVVELPHQDETTRAVLTSALAKLSQALGIDDQEVVDVELSPAASETISAVREAAESSRQIELDYYSYGRDVWTRRVLEPQRLFNAEGQWYLQACAPGAVDVRNFRLDRMRNIVIRTETFEQRALPEPAVYIARDDDPHVVLELHPAARWVAEQYPLEAVDITADGAFRVTLRVSEQGWLERLLLRLGKHAKVIEGKVDISGSAQRILRRYDSNEWKN